MDTATTMGECINCGKEMPDEVLEAANLLYGPSSDRISQLRRALQRASRVNDTDDGIGQKAVLDALGLVNFASLTQAYRHYGRTGECRR